MLTTRKTLAASLLETMKLIDMKNKENQNFFFEVLNHFLKDIDEIRAKILPNLIDIIALFPKDT